MPRCPASACGGLRKIVGALRWSGGWKQTEPRDYSKPEIHWHTWGFEGTSYFAVKLDKTPKQTVAVEISAQFCDGETCAGAKGIRLRVPPPQNRAENLSVGRVIATLVEVLLTASSR